MKNRTERLNSLLKQVISEVVFREVRHPGVHPLVTITRVEITKDLKHAKVFLSLLGNDKEKKETLEALQSAAGFIAIHASKQVVMRYFPQLSFFLDTSSDKQLRIDTLIEKIHDEQKSRPLFGSDGNSSCQ
ncbi:MAG: ribosome-binding factor A [Chlamydiae bacterium GWC2_50_10]|nr:MAG: ribosome-binding factor A [Chlamydiae bacterium GWA2_50_15]OGN54306.1 MAG: ribosome-binding factor A [Chlamydiae bacterium GWF2_49_8]OGN54590.1 MAG: ribosome-binding factor A [Chlamydiae bacterium GWC2_50_10]OGN57874.1 MAG: ribosome-binding factor A [Chlamydiae bacterium RIFCSPHIGHO2_02_FULL_49_29]OGN63342.1 MAG: ribosome-binding factor A [Chlamydiae bacterium RIFCSPHIGHO2_12_FULL_49_32]OGN69669.1 MAG: ribosome-binding factor A [Chlamydiae bacterium RIFCSPLOWO2_02_FULL_49_12]OGN75169.